LKAVCDYVHLNPVRAKLLRPDQRLLDYRWSSWPEYLKRPGKRSPWLRVDRVLGEWGVKELKESDEQKAERLVGAMLRAAGWKEEELKRRPKGDMKKARMAARLRSETAMTWLWIAKRLEMGHWRTAANAVRACPRR